MPLSSITELLNNMTSYEELSQAEQKKIDAFIEDAVKEITHSAILPATQPSTSQPTVKTTTSQPASQPAAWTFGPNFFQSITGLHFFDFQHHAIMLLHSSGELSGESNCIRPCILN